MKPASTATLVSALRVLSQEMVSMDGVANAVVYEAAERMQALVELTASQAVQIKRLEEWKQSALEVEREWHANAIATMLGGQPGESQRKVIQREVPKLLARIKRLEEAGNAMDKTAEPFGLDTIDEDIPMSDVGEQYEIIYDSPPTAGDHVAMDRARKDWRNAKEAKP